MSLQRIERVLIRDLRSWRGEHEFTFDQDISVLHGPNGSGKSSLWTGIVLGLLYKIRGSVSEVIRPIGGGASNTYVEIDFIANGNTYRIEKTFAKSSSATARLTNLETGETLAQDDNAVTETRNIITGSDDQQILSTKSSDLDKALKAATKGQIVDLILPKQGDLSLHPGTNESLTSVGQDTNAESQNSVLLSMIALAIESKVSIRSSQRANASGSLMKALSQLEAKKEEEEILKTKSDELQGLIQEVNDLEIEIGEKQDEEDVQQKINLLRKDADEHQSSRETLEEKVTTVKEAIKPLKTQNDYRFTLRTEFAELNTNKTSLSGEMKVNKSNYSRIKEELKLRKENLETIKNNSAALNEWIIYLQRKDALEAQKLELKRLNNERKTLDDAIGESAKIQAEINALNNASEVQWERIRKINEDIAGIRGAANAWAITKLSPGKEHKIFIDQEDVKDQTPVSVNTSIEVRNSKGEIKLKVENSASLDEIQELETELAEIFNSLSVDGTKELRARQVSFDTKQADIAILSSKISDLDDVINRDDRLAKIEELTLTLASKLIEPKSERPSEGDWAEMLIPLEGQMMSAKTLYEESEKSLQIARDFLTSTKSQLELISGHWESKKEEIEVHVEAYGKDEVIQSALAKEQIKFDTAQENAQPFIDARDANEEQKRNIAQRLQNDLSGGRDTRTRIVELQATIRDRRNTSGIQKLGDVISHRNRLESQVSNLNAEYSALEALENALEIVKTANMEAIRPRVEETIRKGATYVFGREVQITLGNDGFPEAVQHIQGRAIPYGQESYGTQEQLNLIYRITLAGIIAEDEGHGLCIVIDDPFGNSSIARRNRMIEWMGAEQKKYGHQLILLTCRGPDFSGFGHHDDIRQH
jgi:DNA repair exonuclease SbcCD ATPase subunit